MVLLKHRLLLDLYNAVRDFEFVKLKDVKGFEGLLREESNQIFAIWVGRIKVSVVWFLNVGQ